MILLLWVAEAWARVGGGQDFGGSSDGYGGGGSDDGPGVNIGLVRLLLWLCLEHPIIGIPLTIVVIYFWLSSQKQGKNKAVFHGRPRRIVAPSLSSLLERDPNLSEVLLRDLFQLVYLRAWALRSGEAATVPYLSPGVVRALESQQPVSEVVVGGLSIVELREDPDRDRVTVVYEANARESGVWLYLRERWVWARERGAQTPSPAAMRLRACPSCGNPMDTDAAGACQSCGTSLSDGRLNWVVERASTLERRALGAPELRKGGGVEYGTEMATIFHPNLDQQRRKLQTAHPDFAWDRFEARAREIFLSLQTVWSAGDWQKARPLESEPLFHSHNLVLQRYKRAGLRNRADQVRIDRFEVVKVSSDAWYDSVTVRIRASMLDWTEDASGRVVSGSRDQKKVFSEYWTFIRATQAAPGVGTALDQCPSCGAPLDKLSFTGVCGYCDTNVVGGERDWVLSLIVQDELYRG